MEERASITAPGTLRGFRRGDDSCREQSTDGAGGLQTPGFQRGAGRVRRGLASPRWQSHFIRRTQHPSHPANAAGELNRSPSGAWAADRTGMCVHRDVRGSYVGTDAAPGQSGPFATFSPEDVCHRDLEAACTSQETSFGHSGSLSL